MKKLYILYLVYYAVLHAIMPLIYYCLRGEIIFLYKLYCPEEHIYYAAIIIIVPILITIALILIFDRKKSQQAVVINRRMDIYFYIVCMYVILLWNHIGSFRNSAVINGTWMAIINLIFDTNVLLLILMINAYEKCNVILISLTFLLATLSANSRQGALTLVFVMVAMLLTTEEYKKQRKYSLLNQLKLCANNLIPGDIFAADVRPTQYYRTIFLNVSEAQAKATYTSINLTFPGYIYLKYSSLALTIILTVGCLVCLYFVGKKLKRFPLIRTVWTVYTTASFLDFFDWVTIVSDAIREMLTVIMFSILYYCVKMYIPKFRLKLRR